MTMLADAITKPVDNFNPDVLDVGMNVGRLSRFIQFQSMVMKYCKDNNIPYETFLRLVNIPSSDDNSPMGVPYTLSRWGHHRTYLEILWDQVNGESFDNRDYSNSI